jgi:GH25 family lysozyme M1 (1,4-beta-N-acetylmuramidase)/fibronectin type 3 domain-containing protein
MKMRKTTAMLAALAAAALFFNTPASLYADALTNTSEVEGEVELTTDSPFTDLTYTHENKFEGYELINGIDVSKWQNLAMKDQNYEIDWAACKEAGVDFVFVRVGNRAQATGEIMEDPYYKQNIEGALANDISVGVYFFSEALTTKEAKEEAKFVLNCIQDYDITLPVVIDYEDASGRVNAAYTDGSLTQTSATKVIRAFCKYVEDAGYTPMVYANSDYLQYRLNGAELAKDYKIWYARYAQEIDPQKYYNENYEYWQYSTGYIGSMLVDCNFLYKNFNIETNPPSAADQTVDSITLEWEKTSDALGYRVYRLNPDTGKYTKIATTKDFTYTDTGLSAGTEYTYKIRAYWTIGSTTYTAKYSTTVAASTSVKQVKNLTVSARTGDSITLSWDAVSKASGYNIYRYDADSEEYLEIGSVSGKSNTTYQVTGLSGSKEYKFVVRAYRNSNGEKLTGEASEALSTRTNPVKVKSLTASATTASSISLEFTTQKRVTGYYVYRYDASAEKWKKIGTSTDGTFTDDTVAVSTAYKYRVRAYKTSGDVTYYGKYSSVLTVRSNPDKVKNLTASKTTSKSISLKFTTQKRVTGYLVYRYDESTEKWKKLGTSKDGTFTDNTVAANTSYKYRVRAYKTSGGVTYYGKYSKALTVKSAKAKKKS